jgi:hypothetical protein
MDDSPEVNDVSTLQPQVNLRSIRDYPFVPTDFNRGLSTARRAVGWKANSGGEHERIRPLYGGNCRRAFLAGVAGRDGQ